MKSFYMVMRENCPEGFNGTPTKRYDTVEDAIRQATILCKKEKESFLILQCRGRIVPEINAKWEGTDKQNKTTLSSTWGNEEELARQLSPEMREKLERIKKEISDDEK